MEFHCSNADVKTENQKKYIRVKALIKIRAKSIFNFEQAVFDTIERFLR